MSVDLNSIHILNIQLLADKFLSGQYSNNLKNENSRRHWLIISIINCRGGGAVSKSVPPTSGRLGVRIQAATDLSRKTKDSESSTAKCSAISVSVTGHQRWPLHMDALCLSMCGTLINPHCSMAMSVEQRSKFATLPWQWWRLNVSEKFKSRTKNPKQTNNYKLTKSL